MVKGISPLIASVLLIAFTMAIAGIMATWATTFSRERLDTAGSEASCIGILDISSLKFDGTTMSVKIRNMGSKLNLTGMRASLEYSDRTKNREYIVKDYNVTDPLPPAGSSWLVINTTDTTAPERLVIVAQNCPKNEAVLNFR